MTANALVLSIVIPAHNEEGSIAPTIEAICAHLGDAGIPYEVVVVNDHSSDGTSGVVNGLAARFPTVRVVDNERQNGFGNAIHTGLEQFRGDAVCIVMADASDDPVDIITYYRKIEEGYDCAFGSRFMRGATVVDYPQFKLLLNRLSNQFIRVLFRLTYNDATNAFKMFRREVIAGINPILSHHFNITVELPLKAIVRGFSYAVVPTNWYNRKDGVSKFRVKEMGSRYLFIVLYVLIEKYFSRGDYNSAKRPERAATP